MDENKVGSYRILLSAYDELQPNSGHIVPGRTYDSASSDFGLYNFRPDSNLTVVNRIGAKASGKWVAMNNGLISREPVMDTGTGRRYNLTLWHRYE